MMSRERNLRDSLLNTLESLLADEFDRFKHRLSYIDYDGRENIPRCQLEEANTRFKLVDLLYTFYCEDGAVNVAIYVLIQINRRDAAAKLTEKALGPSQTPGTSAEDYRVKYRKHIQKKYQLIKDRNARLGENVNLNSRYTKLIIVNKYRHEKEREHEIMAVGWRHAEIMSEQAHSSITIDTLFKPDENGQMPQIVVLLGAAGIGKTMTARKIMLDWAAGRLYQEFDYVFYINCREMNLLTKQGNMADMILKHCPNNSAPIKHILENTEKLLFIIDGFDELRFSFDQPEDNLCSDPWEKKPVEIILSSLFRKTVLSECYLIITTRPTALEKLRQFLEYPRYAEILGFSKEDREEYFNKFFRDEKQATTAFNFVCENEILLTMCFVPIVCWIICTVLKQQMERGKDLAQTSKTLTEVYLLYLFSLVQSPSSSSKPHMQASLRRLCSLAVDGLWKQKILFEEEEIKKYGLDQVDSLPLFLNENIFQKDIDCECAYSFIHLTFQEFFAALFYVLEEDEETMKDSVIPNRDVKELLIYHGQSASCLITVHFLFGLLNKNRMKDIEEKLGCKISHEIKPDLKTWVVSSLPSNINQCYYLEEFYYLYEIQEENFVKNALEHLTNLETWEKIFTQMDQMVLSFCIKHCHQLESLLIHYCVFRFEDHEEEKFPSLPKWLCQGQPKRSSIYLLCQALEDPNCKLKKLQLNGCFLSITSCWRLAAVLRTNQSLTELDLGYNQYIGNSGVQLLCEGLKHPNCKLQTLGLWNCDLKGASCGYLAAVLRTSQSLTKLELRDNVSLGDSGVQLLCEGLKHPNCKLQILGLGHCSLTAACCGDLSSASSSSQRLTELELENKKLGDSRVQLLWEGPPDCNKQMIQLLSCNLTTACCGNVSSVLSTSQTLTELDLKNNTIRDSGVQLLCEGLKHPNCKLQKLGLRSCSLTAACCGDLSCVLSTSQALTELDIGGNKLGQSGVQLLCEGLKHPNCKLQKLILEKCDFTAACCRELSSALSTSQTLTELDLRENKLEDSGVKLLCEGLTQPACNLQKLVLSKWHVTKETQAELDAVKKIKPELVIET